MCGEALEVVQLKFSWDKWSIEEMKWIVEEKLHSLKNPAGRGGVNAVGTEIVYGTGRSIGMITNYEGGERSWGLCHTLGVAGEKKFIDDEPGWRSVDV